MIQLENVSVRYGDTVALHPVSSAWGGSVVDEMAVAQALEDGWLSGYAADVFGMEDWIRAERRRHIPEKPLSNTAQTFFTPHPGFAVRDAGMAIERYCANSILQALACEVPDGHVNVIAG